MGPGGRQDTLDDFCGFANWKKVIDLGMVSFSYNVSCCSCFSLLGRSLLRKMALAIPDAILHRRAFHSLTDGLKEEHGEQLKEWDLMVREWTADHSKPNPYEVPEDGTYSFLDL